jgi:hypothetical protein
VIFISELISDQRGYGKDFAKFTIKKKDISYKKLDDLHQEEVICRVCFPLEI